MMHKSWIETNTFHHSAFSDLYVKEGNARLAKDHLSEAMTILRDCGADGWVEKTEKKLAAIS